MHVSQGQELRCASGRIFPKEDYKYGRENTFSPEFVLSYKPKGKNMQAKVQNQ